MTAYTYSGSLSVWKPEVSTARIEDRRGAIHVMPKTEFRLAWLVFVQSAVGKAVCIQRLR